MTWNRAQTSRATRCQCFQLMEVYPRPPVLILLCSLTQNASKKYRFLLYKREEYRRNTFSPTIHPDKHRNSCISLAPNNQTTGTLPGLLPLLFCFYCISLAPGERLTDSRTARNIVLLVLPKKRTQREQVLGQKARKLTKFLPFPTYTEA